MSCCGRSGGPVPSSHLKSKKWVPSASSRTAPSDQRVRHVGIGYLLVDLDRQAPAVVVGRGIPSAKVGHLVQEPVDRHRLAKHCVGASVESGTGYGAWELAGNASQRLEVAMVGWAASVAQPDAVAARPTIAIATRRASIGGVSVMRWAERTDFSVRVTNGEGRALAIGGENVGESPRPECAAPQDRWALHATTSPEARAQPRRRSKQPRCGHVRRSTLMLDPRMPLREIDLTISPSSGRGWAGASTASRSPRRSSTTRAAPPDRPGRPAAGQLGHADRGQARLGARLRAERLVLRRHPRGHRHDHRPSPRARVPVADRRRRSRRRRRER